MKTHLENKNITTKIMKGTKNTELNYKKIYHSGETVLKKNMCRKFKRTKQCTFDCRVVGSEEVDW